MRKIIIGIFKVLLVSVSVSAGAANFACTGTVSSIALSPTGGTLQVNGGFGVHYLCKIHTEYNGVHPEICKAWYSMFLTAQASGRQISQTYSQVAGGAQNCSQLGSWVTPNPLPYYVALGE